MQKKPFSRGLFALFVTGGIILALIVFSIIPATRKPLEYISNPVMRAFYSFGQWVHNIPNPFISSVNLQKENKTLTDDLLRVQREADLLRLQVTQQKISTDANLFLQSIQREGILGNIVGKSYSDRKFLYLDVGTDKMLEVGFPVINELGYLVGKISSVTSSTATVTLITDPQSSIGAKIQNEKNSPGIIKGSFGLAMTMDLIPQDDPVETHQSIVTSAIDPLIPPNISVGTISEIHKTSGSVFQQAQVISLIPLERLETVIIILPKK